MKPLYTLDRWSLRWNIGDSGDDFLNLHGFSDHRYQNGEWIYTSQIVGIEGRVVETRNSRYELGDPAEWYAAQRAAAGDPVDMEKPLGSVTIGEAQP